MAKNKPTTQPNVIIPPADDSDESPASTFSLETEPVKLKKTNTVKKIHHCPKCDAEIHHRSIKCKSCGAAFTTEEHIVKEVAGSAATGETKKRGPNKAKATTAAPPAKVDNLAFLKVLKGRGYDISVTMDVLDPDATPEVVAGKDIKPLVDLVKFDKSDGGIQCISTSPSIRFEVDLDTLMGILKIPVRK